LYLRIPTDKNTLVKRGSWNTHESSHWEAYFFNSQKFVKDIIRIRNFIVETLKTVVMKNYLSILLAGILVLISTHSSEAQVPRTPLVEHFSNASCGPCAAQNPALHTLLESNPSVVYIKYQVSWPGSDPMNAHNPGQVNQRVNFYGVNGVPQTVFDGNVYKGSPSGMTQTMINTRSNVSSPFSLSISSRISEGQDSIYVSATYRKEADTSNTAVYLRILVLEKHIQFASPAGSNGERDFYHVMKRMLPNPVGTAVPTDMNVGDVETVELSWKLSNIYEVDQLMVVGFLQNHNNKNVYQSAAGEAYFTSSDAGIENSGFQVNVYPNPANSIANLNITGTEQAHIQVYNASGIQVYEAEKEPGQNLHTLPTDRFTPGVYFIRVSNEEISTSTRLLISAQ